MELQTIQIEAAPASESTLNTKQPSAHEAEAEDEPTPQSYLKLICAGFSFFYAGTNDGTLGPLLPYMLQSYGLSTGLVTVMYTTRSSPTMSCLR
jgi:hypothetical protein